MVAKVVNVHFSRLILPRNFPASSSPIHPLLVPSVQGSLTISNHGIYGSAVSPIGPGRARPTNGFLMHSESKISLAVIALPRSFQIITLWSALAQRQTGVAFLREEATWRYNGLEPTKEMPGYRRIVWHTDTDGQSSRVEHRVLRWHWYWQPTQLSWLRKSTFTDGCSRSMIRASRCPPICPPSPTHSRSAVAVKHGNAFIMMRYHDAKRGTRVEHSPRTSSPRWGGVGAFPSWQPEC